MVYTTLLLCIGVIGYLSSKMYDIWGAKQSRFQSSRNSLTFFSMIVLTLVSLTIIVTLLTMAAAIANMQHFGEGLMQRLASSANLNSDRENPEPESFAFEARRR
jgi:uncharacterized BrkB/YihY/UPF0761 family membrane protein